jgi:hypothetical protein
MNPHQRHNLKADAQTQRLLRLIAASTGERQYTVLARVLAAEWQRVQRQENTTTQKGHGS